MIVHHIAIIVSSETGVLFYKSLGLIETRRIDRGYDQVVFLEGDGIRLEIFIDPGHGQKIEEQAGLRHVAFAVRDFYALAEIFGAHICDSWYGTHFFWVKDPDGQTVEIVEPFIDDNFRTSARTQMEMLAYMEQIDAPEKRQITEVKTSDTATKIKGIPAFEKTVWLSSPTMHGDELRYMTEAYELNWMSTIGKNIDEAERIAAETVGCKYAVGLNCGTSALHLAMRLAGVKPGVKVACSDMTFDATVNPVSYEGGVQVFIDSEYETWNMDPAALDKAFEIYPDIRVVVCAELYGTPGRMDEIREICDSHGAIMIEDAAEALGATYKGRACGSFGTFNAISFNGNKIITGSSGGMLLTDDLDAANRCRKWSTQSREDAPWYQHEELGYNYRMSNVIAGVVRGQFPYLKEHIAQKKAIYERYRDGLKDLPVTMNPFLADVSEPNFWLSCLLIDEDAMCEQVRSDNKAVYYKKYRGTSCPTEIFQQLMSRNAQCRPIWKPMHMQPIYRMNPFITIEGSGRGRSNAYIRNNRPVNVGEDVFERGLCLPSDNKMTPEQQDRIIEIIRACFAR